MSFGSLIPVTPKWKTYRLLGFDGLPFPEMFVLPYLTSSVTYQLLSNFIHKYLYVYMF